MREAQKSGVGEIVDNKVLEEEEVDKDMQLLTKQQEMLLNELKRSYQEDAQRAREDEDDTKCAEMEKRLRALNLDFTPKSEQELDELKTVCSGFILSFCCRRRCRFHFQNTTIYPSFGKIFGISLNLSQHSEHKYP